MKIRIEAIRETVWRVTRVPHTTCGLACTTHRHCSLDTPANVAISSAKRAINYGSRIMEAPLFAWLGWWHREHSELLAPLITASGEDPCWLAETARRQ